LDGGVKVVVGAGLSGLSLARELLDRGFQVRVLELRRRVGGISIVDSSVRGLLDKLSDTPVELEKAVVRIGGRTLAVSRSGVEEVVDGVTATGPRVPSPAELGILGDRPSGIYPFHVALDLLVEGLRIGRRVAVYGLNRYSVLLARKLLEEGVREAYIVAPRRGLVEAPGDIKVVEGRIRRVKGSGRLEEVLVGDTVLEVDALVIALFRTWNPFPGFEEVGHAAVEVYDPQAVVETARLLAENISCESSEALKVKVEGEVQVFPRVVRRCLKKILVARPGGGRVIVNGVSVDLGAGYAVVDLGGASSIEISVEPDLLPALKGEAFSCRGDD